jgi:hypothetical protein
MDIAMICRGAACCAHPQGENQVMKQCMDIVMRKGTLLRALCPVAKTSSKLRLREGRVAETGLAH